MLAPSSMRISMVSYNRLWIFYIYIKKRQLYWIVDIDVKNIYIYVQNYIYVYRIGCSLEKKNMYLYTVFYLYRRIFYRILYIYLVVQASHYGWLIFFSSYKYQTAPIQWTTKVLRKIILSSHTKRKVK